MWKIFSAILLVALSAEAGVLLKHECRKEAQTKNKNKKSKDKVDSKKNKKKQEKKENEKKKEVEERSDKQVIQTNEKNFKQDVLDKDFVIVDFYADWCGPCRMILPYLDEIASELGVDIVKVNIDESPNIASEYNVMSIPTIIIFKKGEKVSTNVGAASKARLVDWIEAHRK